MKKTSHQLINADSGNVEIYTPGNIVEAARRTLGAIDLDPASSEAANQRVQAKRFMSEGALDKPWGGRVWMNHPFGPTMKRPTAQSSDSAHAKWHAKCAALGLDPLTTDLIGGNDRWVNKLVSEYCAGNVTAACAICFASTSEKWFRPLLAYPQCFLSPRTNYLLPDGTVYRGVTKGSVVTYFGPDVTRFAVEFSPLGAVKVAFR